MSVLVVGSTGVVGRRVCSALRAMGQSVRGLVRVSSEPGVVAGLRSAGVEVVRGDLRSPDSLAAACAGIETAVSTATAIGSQRPDDGFDSVDMDGQIALIDAAAGAGVSRFVYVSVRGSVTAYGDGTSPLAWVHSHDVADIVAAVAKQPAVDQRAEVVVLGPQALAPNDVIAVFEEVTGRRFDVTHVPVDQLEAQRAGAEHPVGQSFAALMLRYAAGDPVGAEPTAGLPSAPTTVEDHARRVTSGT